MFQEPLGKSRKHAYEKNLHSAAATDLDIYVTGGFGEFTFPIGPSCDHVYDTHPWQQR